MFSANRLSSNSAFWIAFCLFPIHSARAIFSCLVEAESHSVRVEVMLQADCLSVRITADTNRLLMLLLKPVSVRPWSSNLALSPMIYWQHCICLPLPLQAEFLTNPVPGYGAIIKNVWQDLRAVRDGFSEAGRAGEDGITQVWRHMAAWLTALIPFTATLKSQTVDTVWEVAKMSTE